MENIIEIKQKLLGKMLLVRSFEERVLDLFSEGKLFGTTHAYIGQEANAAGVISALEQDDFIVSNHRCHGHYLSFRENPYALLCEMMGKKDGLCSGRGGSQHICDGNFFSNGVQGGILPLSAGLAFAQKSKGNSQIATVFIGDGTLGEGVVYEVLNIASKWELPLLIIVENNRYAQSTKIEKTLAGKIADRFSAFDINATELSSFDALEIFHTSENVIGEIRSNSRPQAIILNTYRFASHSKSDDGRSQEEIESWLKNDPLKVFEEHISKDMISKEREGIDEKISKVVQQAIDAEFA